ncbi:MULTISPECIES: TDT family transporter [unclassified Haematobacter]|uniref:TDT family transporter n=1 Tax=unclassified Haematobacter TaxID=2640585 RepID=UPI0025C20B2F|nr:MULTISPECIES: TDT family transporter [unclassified Haematobacter]
MRTVTSTFQPLSRLDSSREVVRQFTPNWFAVTMGTGILAVALAQTPFRAMGEVLWVANIVLFSLFTVIYAARWAIFPGEVKQVFNHPVMAMFFGCIPMGLATIINGFLIYGAQRFGASVFIVAETLWWIDVALAALCGVAIPYMMFTRQSHSMEQMTAVWLLPVVAAEVAAVSGGLLAPHAVNGLTVLWVSYTLWALSVPIAMSMLVVLLLRLALHKLPHASMAASSWLALGPIATGALGLMTLGQVAPDILTAHGLDQYGAAASGIGLIGGVMMWGYGLWWCAMALLITCRYLRDGLPFNLGWWGYTFPIGVYALATLKLSVLLPITAIGLLGYSMVGLLGVIWVIVAGRTLAGAWRGELFASPCVPK